MNGIYNTGDVVFGEWKLAKLLGQGSYGKVFEGHREDYGQVYKAAIKIITIPQSQNEIQSARAEGLDDASVTSYFHSLVEEMVQEFGIMAKLKGNSNIVSYEDHQVIPHTEGIGWDIIIRMEQLVPMLDYMNTHPFSKKDVVKVAIDMCKALELCRKFDIIHRDIKPENMFVSELGDYKLGDFGIARTIEKNTGNMSKKGTYTYMAPEIYKEDPYDFTADIYSLGIVLYRLLNNNRAPLLPLTGAISHSQREQALYQRISGAPLPKPVNADGALADAVMKACAYKPADRWQSPTAMRMAFEELYFNMNEDGTEKHPTNRSVSVPSYDEDDEGTVSAVAPRRTSAPILEEDEGTVSFVARRRTAAAISDEEEGTVSAAVNRNRTSAQPAPSVPDYFSSPAQPSYASTPPQPQNAPVAPQSPAYAVGYSAPNNGYGSQPVVQSPAQPAMQTYTVPQAPAYYPQYAPGGTPATVAAAGTVTANPTDAPASTNKGFGSKKGLVIGLAAALVLVVALAVCLLFIKGGNSEPEAEPEPSQAVDVQTTVVETIAPVIETPAVTTPAPSTGETDPGEQSSGSKGENYVDGSWEDDSPIFEEY